MDQGGNFNGLGNQAYHPGSQQQQPQQQQQANQGFFAQGNSGYGNIMGGGQQQQQAGNNAGMFGQPQHSGLQQLDSTGPFASQGMQLAPGGSMQDAFGGKAVAGGMDGQQQQPQQNQQQGQGDPQSQAAMWQQAFFKLAAAAGVPADPSQGQPPEAVIEQAQAARHRDPWVQAQARDAAMQVQAAVLTAQNIHLRRELASGWAAADSNMIQVQQLILDPAIEHEFQHLRAQLALRVSETEAAKAAYEGQAFTAESKMGHALLRKVKVLTEENEDLGRQQRQSKQAAQGAVAAVEQRHADELREELQDTRDLCNFYQQENEELNMVSMLYQRQLEQVKQQMAAQPAPTPDRDFGRDRLLATREREARPFSRSTDRERAPAPRDRSPGLRDRAAERARDRTTERSREREGDRAAPRERESFDMDRTRGGYAGGRFDRGGRFGGRGRGRNLSQQYAGAKRPR